MLLAARRTASLNSYQKALSWVLGCEKCWAVGIRNFWVTKHISKQKVITSQVLKPVTEDTLLHQHPGIACNTQVTD